MITYYDSDSNVSKNTYKSTYRRYPSFFLGLILMFMSIGIVSICISNAIYEIRDQRNLLKIIFYIMAALLNLLLIFFELKLIKMGKKKEIIGYPEYILSIYNDHLSLEYVPLKKGYSMIRENIYFCDITKMVYEQKKKRLKIVSAKLTEMIVDLTKGNNLENIHFKETEKKPLYIYDRFGKMEEIINEIEKFSLKKIRFL